jgi:hypothetical protein
MHKVRGIALGTVVIVQSDEPDVPALRTALNSSVQDAGRPAQAGS